MIGRDFYASNATKSIGLFHAGMEKLNQQNTRSAMRFLLSASYLGHKQAKNYLEILRTNKRSANLWRDIILAAEINGDRHE